MLSEDLQDGIGGNQTTESGVPHGTKVFASGFVQLNGERLLIEPLQVVSQSVAKTCCEGFAYP